MSQTETPSSSPVFLVGAERSMTTLLRLMLDHHPQLAWHEEFEFAVDFMPEEGWPEIDAYHEWLSKHRIFLEAGLTINPDLSYPDLIRSFLEQRRRREGKPLIGATCHRHYDRLLRIWPDARFIHILRDGRDVARSYLRMGWAGNLWTASHVWLAAERLWDRTQALLPEGRWMELRTEALVHDPAAVLSEICEFLGLAYDPAMLNYPNDTPYAEPDEGLLYQWKRYLSDEDIRLIEAAIGPMLENRGYRLSGFPRLTLTPVMKGRLRVSHRMNRIRARVGYVGPRLVVEDFLARKLGFSGWAKRTQLKINDRLTRSINS